MAVIRRAVTRGHRASGPRRVRLTADRGFAAGAVVDVVSACGVTCIIRVKGSTTVAWQGRGRALRPVPFVGTARQRNLGGVASGERLPHRLWVTRSRVRTGTGQGELGDLSAKRPQRAQATARAYARRFGCEQGLRAAKWELGVAQARIQHLHAWSRLFALFALALLVGVSWGVKRLGRGGPGAVALLRRVASRRRGRWDLSVVSAIVSLLHTDKSFFVHLSPRIPLDLEATLANVS